jgi:hypothetical protein
MNASPTALQIEASVNYLLKKKTSLAPESHALPARIGYTIL